MSEPQYSDNSSVSEPQYSDNLSVSEPQYSDNSSADEPHREPGSPGQALALTGSYGANYTPGVLLHSKAHAITSVSMPLQGQIRQLLREAHSI